MATASTSYISIGANRAFSGASSSSSGIFAYAAGTTVALWDMNDRSRGVYATLLGHKADVTTVTRINERDVNGRTCAAFVSGDGVGEVRVWDTEDGKRYTCTHHFTAHKGSISAIGVVPFADGTFELMTGGSDGGVVRWKLSSPGPAAEAMERISLNGRLPLDIDAALLPGSTSPVVVIGATDRRVQVWTLSNTNAFKLALSLEGHEDWVRCVALTPYPGDNGTTDLLLATGAQDNYVRLWRIAPALAETTLDLLDEFESRIGGGGGTVQISTRAHVLSVAGDKKYNVQLEALLIGHEAGLSNLHWSPDASPLLLSSAADNSLIIWSPTDTGPTAAERDGIWVPEHRFGAFGGRGLCFFGAVWGSADAVIATGWTGGVERWVRGDGGAWETASGLSGHWESVHSAAWDPRGDYLLTTSSDQTSRIHAACNPSGVGARVWAEIARPQIHGYDMVDAAFLSSFGFASAGEEKVLRVFEGTSGFAGSLRGLGVRERDSAPGADEANLPKGATVPPLGLSNRALGQNVTAPEIKTQNEARDSVAAAMTSLPTEEELGTSTLWPEIEKIYGHGYEIATLAASHVGDLVATASRASSAEHAGVRVVSTSTWGLVGTPLPGHSLTVTRIAFSPDDSRILTVSRDRSWRLFSRTSDNAFEPAGEKDKAHARMILDAAWAPCGTLFATASRDKTVKIWSVSGEVAATLPPFEAAATAVAFRAAEKGAGALLAVGTEGGSVHVYSVVVGVAQGVTVTPVVQVSAGEAHGGAVSRLSWSPASTEEYTLASVGADRAVRVYEVRV